MGIFGPSKEMRETYMNEARRYVKQKLSESRILFLTTPTLNKYAEEEHPWILNCTGYRDNRCRTIIVGEDLFSVLYGHINFENGKPIIKEDAKFISLGYTNEGYKPLHSYSPQDNENVFISKSEVLKIWMEVICESMKEAFPELKFNGIHEEGDYVRSSYYVPAIEWEDWF